MQLRFQLQTAPDPQSLRASRVSLCAPDAHHVRHTQAQFRMGSRWPEVDETPISHPHDATAQGRDYAIVTGNERRQCPHLAPFFMGGVHFSLARGG